MSALNISFLFFSHLHSKRKSQLTKQTKRDHSSDMGKQFNLTATLKSEMCAWAYLRGLENFGNNKSAPSSLKNIWVTQGYVLQAHKKRTVNLNTIPVCQPQPRGAQWKA